MPRAESSGESIEIISADPVALDLARLVAQFEQLEQRMVDALAMPAWAVRSGRVGRHWR